MQYLPHFNQLIFSSTIEITLEMEVTDAPALNVHTRIPSNQALYDNILETIVDNSQDIPTYQGDHSIEQTEYTPGYYEYVIITTDALKNNFDKFIEWKKRKGINIGLVTVEYILSHYSGDLISGIYDDAGKIRQYLKDAYEEGTVWALLGGDYTIVPIRYGCGQNCDSWNYDCCNPPNCNPPCSAIDTYKIPADLYFADFSGDWDVDSDEFYGQPYGDNPDYNPEIFVGRLLCSSSTAIQDIENWTEKIIRYEQNPGDGGYDYLTKSFMTESDQLQYYNQAEQVANQLPSSFTHTIWKELPNGGDPNPYFPFGAQVISEMNNHYGLYSWFNHGAPNTISVRSHNYNQSPWWLVTSTDNIVAGEPEVGNGLDNLTNESFPSICYSIGCDNTPFDILNPCGWFTGRNMGQGFTVITNTGGPAFLGNTRFGWVGTSYQLYKKLADLIRIGGIDPESGKSHLHLGVAELVSKQQYTNHYLSYSHNLVGCPETQIWINTPNLFTGVNVSDGGTYITVSTGLEGCDMNARSLDNGVSYNFSCRDVSSFTFNTTVRPLLVTITKSQYLPFTVLTGGTLTSDFTISVNLNVFGNLVVASGIHLDVEDGRTVTFHNDLTIAGTLTLQPGSEIKFHNGASLIVNGTLIAQGTYQQQITLDFVNSQGNGISVRNGGTINLDYCKIKNASTGISTFHAANTILVNHCTFENITGNGISVGANNQKLEVYNSTFSGCGSYCINIFGQMVTTPKIYYNHFQNTAYGILASSVNIVQINWNSFSNTQLGMSIIHVPDAHIIGNYLFSTLNLNSGIFFNNSNGYLRQNVIYGGHKRGISLANSSPKIGENQIIFNKVNGIYASAGSVPDLRLFLGVSQTPGCPPYYYALSGCNEISDNGGYTQGPFGEVGDDGSEIYLSRSFILLDNGNNKIVDDRDEIPPLYHTLLLMNGTTNQDARIMARYNWWGLREVNRERFGTLSVIWEPIGADDCPVPPLAPCSLIVNGIDGMPIDTLYPVYDAEEFSDLDEEIAIADKYYLSGDYNNAITTYNNVVQDYPDSIQAFLAGSQLFIINKIQNSGLESFTALQNFYNTYAGNVSDTLLVKMIENLITLCYIGKEEYETAIGRLEDIIVQNPEEEEAIYAEIDAITAAMLANNGGGNLGKYAGKYAATSLDDYGNKIGELVAKLGSSGSGESKESIIPAEYKLYQNYPNPFNPVTTIKYDIVKAQDVKLAVYDILGREVAALVNVQQQQPGSYEVNWDASGFASGIYFYTLTSGNFMATKKLILLK